jgi:uncharacterized protein (DUF983 family)
MMAWTKSGHSSEDIPIRDQALTSEQDKTPDDGAGNDSALFPPVDPFKVGIQGCCPRCGNGKLFDGLLGLKPRCAACDLDYAFADAGDGPAVFVILIVGFIVIGAVLWLQANYGPPIWVHILLFAPLTIILSLLSLRWCKGILIALQYRNKASEGRLHRD